MVLLIIEDDIGTSELINEQLKGKSRELFVACSANEAVNLLSEKKVDLMLLDYGLPDMNGIEFINELRLRNIEVPNFIVSTGRGDERVAVEMMKQGAKDYVVKDMNFLEILPRVVERVEDDIEKTKKLREAELNSKLAYDALSRSEKQLRTLFEESLNAIFVVEKSTGRYIDANKAGLKLTGRTLDEITSLTTSDITPHGSENRLLKVADNHTAIDMGEVVYYRPDGTQRTALLTVIPFDTNLTYGIAHDITERKKAENDLKDSEQLFRSAFFTSPDAININDMEDGSYLSINEGFTEITGYTWQDVKGKTSDEIEIWVNRSDRDKLIAGLKEDGLVKNLESQFRMKDGGILTGLISATILEINDKTHILSITRDITQRKRAEDELKLHSAVMNSMNEGVVFLSESDFTIRYANPKLYEIFGYEKDELINKPITILGSALEGSQDKFRDDLFHKLKIEGEWQGEIESIKKDGTQFWCWVSFILLEHSQLGRIMVGVHTDITERVKAQIELANYQIHLEDMIEKRTEELKKVNTQLQEEVELRKKNESNVLEALKKEKELNELKTSFVSTVSHEFRTPLTTILSSIELLQRYGRKWEEDKYLNHTEKVVKSIEQLTTLMDSVLLISRTDNGKIEFKPHKINLDDFFQGIISELSFMLLSTHEMRYEFLAKEKYYFLDENLLRLIFLNLLSNAIKYSPEGGKIILSVKCEDKILVSLSDEGIGIDAKDQTKVFDSFFRAEDAYSFSGTGLGLTIARRSTELHKGKIFLESKKGSGTKFKIELPLIEHDL